MINGVTWKIGKPSFILNNNELAPELKEQQETLASNGKTIVLFERDHEVCGLIALKDQVRQETKAAVKQLNDQGIYTIMLTGDSQSTAQAISTEANVEDFIAECLPEKKWIMLRN